MPDNALIRYTKSLMKVAAKGFDPYIAEGAVVVPSAFRNTGAEWFFAPNNVDYKFIFVDAASAKVALDNCPPFQAIISRKTQAYINGKVDILNSKGKPAVGGDAQKIRNLLAEPNPFDSQKRFEASVYANVQVFGFCVCLPIYSYGFGAGGPKDASSIWALPSCFVKMKLKRDKVLFRQQKLSDIVEYIRFCPPNADPVEFTPEQVDQMYIFRDMMPAFDMVIIPDSRVRANAQPIRNIIMSYESRGELIGYAGSQGIITPEFDQNGPLLLKEGEKEQLQADFKRQYGIRSGQFRYIISPAPMKWQQMGRPTKDLLLFEEIVDDIMRLCDSYGYPSPLLNSEKGPSVSNTKEFKSALYTDTVIPEADDLSEQWNAWFQLEPTSMTLVRSFDHIPVLKSDQVDDAKSFVQNATALQIAFQNNLLTINQWCLEMGFDEREGGDIYYTDALAAGWSFGATKLPLTQPETDETKPTEPAK